MKFLNKDGSNSRGGKSRRTVQAVEMIAQTLGYYPFAVGMLIQHEMLRWAQNYICVFTTFFVGQGHSHALLRAVVVGRRTNESGYIGQR